MLLFFIFGQILRISHCIKLLIRAALFQLRENTKLGCNEKLGIFTCLGIFDDACGASDIIGKCNDFTSALPGEREALPAGALPLQPLRLPGGWPACTWQKPSFKMICFSGTCSAT